MIWWNLKLMLKLELMFKSDDKLVANLCILAPALSVCCNFSIIITWSMNTYKRMWSACLYFMIWFVDLNVGNRPVDANWPCLFCYQKFCDASLFKVLYMWLRHWVKAFSHKICWKLWDRRGAWLKISKIHSIIH